MISQSMDLTKSNLAASMVEVKLAWTGEEQINKNVNKTVRKTKAIRFLCFEQTRNAVMCNYWKLVTVSFLNGYNYLLATFNVI